MKAFVSFASRPASAGIRHTEWVRFAKNVRSRPGPLTLLVIGFVPLIFAFAQVHWKDAMNQPASWYGSSEALRVADNLLKYQYETGAWDKNIDMSEPPDPKAPPGHSTIDNGATYTQLEYLARVHRASGNPRYFGFVPQRFRIPAQGAIPQWRLAAVLPPPRRLLRPHYI